MEIEETLYELLESINEAAKLLGKEKITNEYVKQQYGDEALKKIRACGLFDYDNGWYINEEGRRILRNKNKTPVKREEEKYERMLREGFVAVDEDGRIVKIIRENVVNYILETEPPFFTVDDTEEMYRYTDGVYTPWKESQIRHLIKDLVGKLATRTEMAEIINQLKYTKVISRSELNKDKRLNLSNGLLDLETRTLDEHTPFNFSTIRIPVKYDPDATCPKIDAFLHDVLDDTDVKGIYELAGYLLVQNYDFQKAWMFIGEGNNGKSTVISLLEKFIGQKNCSHVPLQTLLKSRFSSSQLYDKLANTYADIPAKGLYETGVFKMLTGGDEIFAEKKFKDPFSFKNKAKLIFSCNELPVTSDKTHAFFRRWIIIQFNKTIKNPDKNILNEITTPTELSGFLNKALDGLERLIKNDKFTNEKSTDEMADLYQRMSDPAYEFFLQKLKPDPEGYCISSKLYTDFINFCNENKLPAKSKQYFFKQLPTFCSCYKTRKLIEGNREWVVQGVVYR